MKIRNGNLSIHLPVHDFLQTVNRNAMIFRLILPIFKPKGFLLIIFLGVLCQQSFAQPNPNKAIDSIENVLKTAVDDTNKVNTLIDLGRNYRALGKRDAALKNNKAALELATKLDFRRGMAVSYYTVGHINYWGLGNFSEALNNFFAALKIWEEIGDKAEIAGNYHHIGLSYGGLNKYAESIKYLTIAGKKYEENGQKGLVADVYNTTGTTHKTLGNYPEALKNYFSALELWTETGYKRGEARCYTNIGNIYKILGNYPEALKNHFSALKLYEEVDKGAAPIAYTNIGNVHIEQGNYPEALKYHQAALKIWEEAGNKGGIANVNASMGDAYARQSKFPEALAKYQASLALYEELKSKNGITDCSIGMGNIYIKQNKFTEARELITKAVSLSLETGSKERIKDAYKSLYKLDSIMENYQNAFTSYKLYIIYQDSLFNDGAKVQIAEIKTQAELDKKDNEISQLTNEKMISALLLKNNQDSLSGALAEKQKVQVENEKMHALELFRKQQIDLLNNEKQIQELQIEKNKLDFAIQKTEAEKKQEQVVVLNKVKDIQALQLKKQRQTKNYLIASIALLVIFSFFLYWNYRTRQQLKLQTLRNKIASDLHDDIGSTLSSISIFSQMAQHQSKETIPLLESIGESSRKMLDAMADIVWTINPENDQFEKIISRMKSFAFELLGAKNIDFEFVADQNVADMKLPMEVRKNLYLIFKEATNNMVKYAGANKAMFEIKNEKNDLKMIIRDNGIGFDNTKEVEGNGLKNMKRRATEIGGELTIDSNPGSGTLIELRLAI